jgi:hypothetical protein
MRFKRLLLPLTLLSASTIHAQSFEQLASIRLTDEPMSIRGAGMGNVSIDDPALDPTALAKLERPLFSLGGSRVEFTLATGFIVPPKRQATGLSHAFVAMPAGDFTVSAHYRAQPAIEGNRTPGPGGSAAFEPFPCPASTCSLGTFMVDPVFERRERRYGATVAWDRGPLSIGLGAEIHELEEQSAYGVSASYHSPRPANGDARGGVAATATRFDQVVRSVSGRKVVPNVGIRWDVASRLSVAAAYNGAASFDRVTDVCILEDGVYPGCASEYSRVGTSAYKLADATRASVTFVPLDSLTLIAEAVHRTYSNLNEAGNAAASAYNNVTEYHAGAELRLRNVALRAGWWRDPARWDARFLDMTGSFGQRQDHVTLGAGIGAGQARIDFAVDDIDMPALRRASVGITLGGLGARGR